MQLPGQPHAAVDTVPWTDARLVFQRLERARPVGRGVRWMIHITAGSRDHPKARNVHKGISIFLQTHKARAISLSYLIKISASVSCSQ